ncbi:MAG: hypothetical protein JWM16_363 [Verrucomicrobiales bacterium]|nr:hypothetical protein [Verrucomicrobiales bacterium]
MVRTVFAILLCLLFAFSAHSAEIFRGYYMTFMRMPLMGLPEWKEAVDCLQEDGSNVVILWTGGAFASKRFPITWDYNREHKNVKHDFVRELINYAHEKKIRVLLGFTPFGYDGVNQYAIEHPELKARKADGKPVDSFGIHCWGWSLCPSQKASRDFMLEYAREMAFEFYPNADGLLIESSDYNVCRCAECKEHFYEREFEFVRQISNEVWERKADATVVVFPHYFSGKKVNQGSDIEAKAASQPFDPRWTLVFTPHSAQIDGDLLKQARSSIYWNEGPSRGTPWSMKDGAKTAKRYGLAGYVPSLEPWSYVVTHEEFGESQLTGKRLKPFGLNWLRDGEMPLRDLLVRVQRAGYREFARNPDLKDEEFRRKLAVEFFGSEAKVGSVEDLLFLQRTVFEGRSWLSASPLVEPGLFQLKAAREKWDAQRLRGYKKRLEAIREIETKYQGASGKTEKEMQAIAAFISARWKGKEIAR